MLPLPRRTSRPIIHPHPIKIKKIHPPKQNTYATAAKNSPKNTAAKLDFRPIYRGTYYRLAPSSQQHEGRKKMALLPDNSKQKPALFPNQPQNLASFRNKTIPNQKQLANPASQSVTRPVVGENCSITAQEIFEICTGQRPEKAHNKEFLKGGCSTEPGAEKPLFGEYTPSSVVRQCFVWEMKHMVLI